MSKPLVAEFEVTVRFKNGDVCKLLIAEDRIKSLEECEGWMDMALEELTERLT